MISGEVRKHGDWRNNIKGLVTFDGIDDIGLGSESIMVKFKGFLGEVNAEDVKWLHAEDVMFSTRWFFFGKN